MQEELDTAAAAGFRVHMGSPTSTDEMVIFMERTAEPPNTYKYLLLATTQSDTFQEELAEATAEGYRLLPRTMVSKSRAFGRNEVVAILELAPGETQRYEYKLLATSRTSTLQTEVTELAEAGFVIAGLVSSGEHMVIMERQAQ